MAICSDNLQRPRLLYVIDTLEIGGAEKSVVKLAKLYDPALVAVCTIYSDGPLAKELIDANIQVFSLGISKKYGFVESAIKLRQVVAEFQPEVIHSVLFRSSIVSRIVSLAVNLPLVDSFVSTPYSKERRAYMNTVQLLKNGGLQLLDMTSAGLPTQFIANSRYAELSNCAALRVPRAKVRMIYRGRAENKYLSKLGGIRRFDPSIETSTFKLIFVGRLIGTKRLDVVIRALSEIKEVLVQLCVVGDGPMMEAHRQLARELGVDVVFKGQILDVEKMLVEAHAFVSASELEGLPGAAIEAIRGGLPLILSDVPTHRELSSHGLNHSYFKAASAEDCRRAIEALRSSYGAAKERANKNATIASTVFDDSNMYRKHLEIYKFLARHGRKADTTGLR